MHRVLLLGAGKIGRAIAAFLHDSGDYDVVVADASESALTKLTSEFVPVPTVRADASDPQQLKRLMTGRDSVISALAFSVNPLVAEVAVDSGVSYFDLTEDVQTTLAVRKTAERCGDGTIVMPQCGLAPGFISIVAHDIAAGFESLDKVHMRVGALPQFPTNRLKYNLTWSTDGLINEYCNPCSAIHDGQLLDVLALEGLQEFSLDGVRYEAFNTSGGLGSLCETLLGRVSELNYRTIRYPGHRNLMQFLIRDLKMSDKRQELKRLLEDAVPVTYQDVVITFVSVSGTRDGQFVQVSDARKIYHQHVGERHWAAIQLTTAAGICAVLDLHVNGRLPRRGLVKQEDVVLADFLQNRFGRYFANDKTGR
ncbi:MAG: saccharopine dehydrogenase C-terminal domain-containing protein [Planctomycetaceae bacterium]